MAEAFRCELVSWEQVEGWVAAIVAKMKKDDFRPDVIIGMSRGGIVPSRLVADHFVVKNLYTVKTEHWGLTATPDGKAKLSQTLQVEVRKKRLLVVDDITDTGQSLLLARDHVASLKPEALKTATLLHIAHSLIAPDYYARLIAKSAWTWFIFPWNVREDLRNIVPKALDEPATLSELSRILKDRYSIEPPQELLLQTLEACLESGAIRETKGRFKAVAAPK
jgi:uncharacterized protein